MDIDEFWNIIETARSASTEAKPFADTLVEQLSTGSQSSVLEYEERFDEVHGAVYRWDVWAAAYLIGGGCSDDSFMDFRAGLIAQGREWYERVVASPDSLADHPAVIDSVGARDRSEVLFYEEANYAASGAFARFTGDEEDFHEAWDDYRASRDSAEEDEHDMGEDFDFDDPAEMHRRLPRLADLSLRQQAS